MTSVLHDVTNFEADSNSLKLDINLFSNNENTQKNITMVHSMHNYAISCTKDGQNNN